MSALSPERKRVILEGVAQAAKRPDSAVGPAASARARGGRLQPVHVVYGGAHLYREGSARKLGDVALRTLREHAPDGASLVRVLGLDEAYGGTALDQDALHARLVDKLTREPIEDQRIDFEDGFGLRDDDDEDRWARTAAAELARGLEAGTLPPNTGFRIKALQPETAARSLRTLELFLTSLAEGSKSKLPESFVVTLPKVTAPAQVAALADALDELEDGLGIPRAHIGIELMVETPEALLGPEGSLATATLVAGGRGRVVAAHLGAYDYTAALGIAAPDQSLHHPACVLARSLLQLALAGSGVWISDGATTRLPVGPPKTSENGSKAAMPDGGVAHGRAVQAALREHASNVTAALRAGFYQGWDLHPGQLVPRFAATFAYFMAAAPSMGARLANFVERATVATRVGTAFDDAATAQGILNFFQRALTTGALAKNDVERLTSLSESELRAGSFAHILAARARASGDATAPGPGRPAERSAG